MEIINDSKEKLELSYPCSWSYRLIAHEKKLIIDAVCEVIPEREHILKESNKSKTGKYISMNLDLLVHNEDERNYIFESLKTHKNIKMVL